MKSNFFDIVMVATLVQAKETHEETVNQIVSELSELDDYAIQRICEGLKANFKGQKGRVQGYEWMKKVKPESMGSGKKGRPSDSDEVKLEKLEARMLAQKQAILNKQKDESIEHTA